MNCTLRTLITLTFTLGAGLAAGCGDDSSSSASDTTGATSASATDTAGTTGTSESSGTETATSATSTATTTTASTGTASDSESTSTTTAGTGGDATYCQEACEMDDECTVNGLDAGYVCERGRCVNNSGGCVVDDECVAQFSGWLVECGSQVECPGQVCIDVGGGEGRCATAPSDVVPCATLLLDEAMYPPIEGGEPLTVCAQTAAECNDGTCRIACSSDASCLSSSAPVCNTDTGECECATDAHCDGVPGASVCVAGRCQCAADADCESLDNADVCNDGACGCSSAGVCSDGTVFDGTSQVCEP